MDIDDEQRVRKMRKYSVLIVDDEELAILGLEAGVDWGSLNINRLYKCHSRDEAIHLLEKESVDIIITDIEMPEGDGLELIRWVNENRPEARSIFYTGHAEFSYAREALRLGVDDYLLKPIPYDELADILRKVEEKLEQQKGMDELAEPEDMENAAQIVEQVKKLISENLSEGNLQRDELAAMVHISPGYLGRIFKKETGMALSNYIIKKRITVAKQLLTKTNLSITRISERVGITYSSYFTKLFREQVGMTPQEFRQNYQ